MEAWTKCESFRIFLRSPSGPCVRYRGAVCATGRPHRCAFILLTRHRNRIVHAPVTKQPIFPVIFFFSSVLAQTSHLSYPFLPFFSSHFSLVLVPVQSRSRSVIKIFLRLPGYFFLPSSQLARLSPLVHPLLTPPTLPLSPPLFRTTSGDAKYDLNARKNGR